jgi:hypothetical protein
MCLDRFGLWSSWPYPPEFAHRDFQWAILPQITGRQRQCFSMASPKANCVPVVTIVPTTPLFARCRLFSGRLGPFGINSTTLRSHYETSPCLRAFLNRSRKAHCCRTIHSERSPGWFAAEQSVRWHQNAAARFTSTGRRPPVPALGFPCNTTCDPRESATPRHTQPVRPSSARNVNSSPALHFCGLLLGPLLLPRC